MIMRKSLSHVLVYSHCAVTTTLRNKPTETKIQISVCISYLPVAVVQCKYEFTLPSSRKSAPVAGCTYRLQGYELCLLFPTLLFLQSVEQKKKPQTRCGCL